MQTKKSLLGLLLVLLLLVSCACPKNVFVLLPDPDGSVGAIELTNERGSILLDKAGEGLTVAGPNSPPLSAKPMSRAEIEETSDWKEVIIGPESATGIPRFLAESRN